MCLLASVYTYFPPLEELHDRLRIQSGNLTEAAATLESPHRAPAERSAAKLRALNALDRIDDALSRFSVSRAIRFQGSSAAPLDAEQLRETTGRLRDLIDTGSPDQFKTATLDFTKHLVRGM